MAPRIADYGTWTSPITTDLIVADAVRLGFPLAHGESVYWLEGRPAEKGRVVIVRYEDDIALDLTPAPLNARTRTHEYGGRAYTVADGTVYFSNFSDQRIYRQSADGGEPTPLTAESAYRYADFAVDTARNRLIAVREDHSGDGEAVNTLVAIALDDGSQTVLAAGRDFYSAPRLSPDGTQLAWLEWDHPNMPWDGTELYLAELGNDDLSTPLRIAGGAAESVAEPRWSPAGTLTFISDRTNWWNLYQWRAGAAVPLCPLDAEFCPPQWVFGMSSYVFADASTILCTYRRSGVTTLARLDVDSGELTPFDLPYDDIESLSLAGNTLVFNGGSPTDIGGLVSLDLATGVHKMVRRLSPVTVDDAYLSIPEAIAFATEGGLTAHAFFYPPHNADFVAPDGQKPPVIVFSHGGPTGATSSTLDLRIQFWTSRGFAVLDVNYGGSTGYGRDYRQRLNGQWGIVDVMDCINAARAMAQAGRVDGDRMAIRGGSAGGFTTLAALTFHDVFKAGASYYGVSDLGALARDTHKFESRYLDSMVGPYPERKDLYEARSPLTHADQLSTPVIFLQGGEDKVVPPNQAEMMIEVLEQKGVPVEYVLYPEEGHGFRQADNIKDALTRELTFYRRVFGLGDTA